MLTHFSRRQDRLVINLLSLITAFGILLGSPGPASSFELIIGTGSDGSLSHHCGKLLCRIFARDDKEITCSLSDTYDPVDNLTNVQGGSLDLALVDSLLLEESTAGTGAFQYLDIHYDRIRVVTPLYEVPLTLIVRGDAGISSIDQLPGKRINAGPFGSPEKDLFKMFMQAQGWSEDLFPIFAALPSSLSQDTMAFHQGEVQALVHKGVHPDTEVKKLLVDADASLIGFSNDRLDGLIVANPALSKQKIGKSAYPSLVENLFTFGTTMTLIASADMDDETLLSLVAALERNRQSLRTMHPALSSFTIDRRAHWFRSIKTHQALLK